MATTKNYYITYWNEKSIINPGDSQTYYKVKAVKESSGSGSGIPLTADQYNRWIQGLTAYHYINDENFDIVDSYVDVIQKSEDDNAAQENFKENEVYVAWGEYIKKDMVGNRVAADEFKGLARSRALQLSIPGQKAFIVEQMRYLSGKISVLEDLHEDVTELQAEYSNLILEYENLETT